MCEVPPIKNISVLAFKFKRFELGYAAFAKDFAIYIGRNNGYYWWSVDYKKGQILESDLAYKSDAKTFIQAKKRAVRSLNKWRREHL